MDIDIREILKAVQGEALGEIRWGFSVHKVSTDTRTIEKDDVFFALKGEKFDAHDFVEEAVAKGARHCVVSKPEAVSEKSRKSVNVVCVKDTLKAYGDLAGFYRQKFNIHVIAVTGSSGKTTVKDLTAHLLSIQFKVLKNRGTENNLVGVPKTIFQLEPSHEALVLEIGTSLPGEIERLSTILAPQIGVITQIGHSHLQGLGSIEGVRAEKLKLISGLEKGGTLILNGEDPMLNDVRCGVHRVMRFGFKKETADWAGERIWCHEKGCSFQLNGKDLFETQLFGRHNVLNALAAIGVASRFGIDTAALQKALSSFKPVAGRFHLKEIDGILFVDDSYNSNPGSLRAALETLKGFKTRQRRGAVLGDMLELGEKSEELHRQMGGFLAGLLFDYVITAGPLGAHLADEAVKAGYSAEKVHSVKDSEEAGQVLKKIVLPGDMVLVKGSRGMQMEKVWLAFP